MKKIILTLTISILLLSTPVHAVRFFKTGQIIRTLSDISFGGCMILLDSNIGSACPGAWVSLDCQDVFLSAGTGDRHYASAMLAASLGKQVSMLIDNQQKTTIGGYCVANRIDVLF